MTLFESGAVGPSFYFVMEYCNRGSVDELINRQGGKLSVEVAAPIMMECLDGLAYAHSMQFVHRDMKPGNILLDELDGRW